MSDVPTPTGYQRSQGGGFKWQPPSVEHLAKLLPQYDIERLLGHGGMGAVYQGRQRSLNRPVAIKILPQGLEDEDASYTERFKNEAQILARLSHPCIVAVHDFGETSEGQLYIVMEFVDGTDVAQMIRSQGRLPPEHALAVAAHVCDALSYAHKNGVVHRDIKPANILINHEGAVKVADFGLAKVDEPGTSGLTKTGMAMGTPDYVAPEALIMGTQIDGRADLYAIGVMLYHMLTGEVPRGAFDLPSRRIGTDPRFDAIILKAMKMDREERYQSSGEIRRDLDVILSVPLVQAGGESSAAIPQSTTDTPVRRSPSAAPDPTGMLRSREANAHRTSSKPPSPNPQSKTPMIALTTAAAAVVIAGAFVAFKPASQGETHATKSGAQSSPLSPLSGQAKPSQANAQETVRTTFNEPPSAKPVLVAQANTKPKISPDIQLGQSAPADPVPASGPPSDALRFGNNSYKLIQEVLSFDDAQKRCVSMGGHLVTIASMEEDKFIESLANKTNPVPRLILGGFYDGTKWSWITGEPWGFEYWDKSHDTSKLKPNDVLCMPFGGHWKHLRDRAKLDAGYAAFVCEWDGAAGSVAQVSTTPSATPAAVTTSPAVSQASLPPELTTLQQQYDKLLVERVTGIYDADVAKLNTGYLAGLDRASATAQSGGELDTVLAITAEKKLLESKQPVPATDDAKTPEALKNLRTIYRTSLAKLDEQRTANHSALLTPYATRLKQIEADLTKAGRIPDAVAVKTYREGLGTNPVAKTPVVVATPPTATTPPTAILSSNKVKGDDRAAAEWLVSIGAEFSINTNGRAIKPTKVDELPKGKFVVTSVLLSGQNLKSKVTGDDLKKLAGLQELAFLEFRDINYLTDADLSFVATLPALQKLPLGICPITDDFTEYLVGSKELVDFTSNSPNLTGTKLNKLAGIRSFVRFETGSPNFNDEGAKALSEVKSILRLSFEGCRGLTDAAIPHLSKLTALNHLQVCATSITGAGLAGLKAKVVTLDFNKLSGKTPRDTAAFVGPALPSVTTLRLAQTEGFTREDVAAMAHFKNLKELSFLSIKDPTAWAGLEMLPHIESLNVDRQPFTDGEVDYLLKASGLTLLRLGNVAVTDAGLIKLAGLKKLKTLQLKPASAITDTGLAAFKKARPDVMVEK